MPEDTFDSWLEDFEAELGKFNGQDEDEKEAAGDELI